jgi:predicted nucleic acid-binding protein
MLDFLARREPFFESSASALDTVLYGQTTGVLPAHGVTTLYYLLSKTRNKDKAFEAVRWLLDHFEVAACSQSTLLRAVELDMTDYEDAVVAAHAEEANCDRIVTRNVSDFTRSPVPAVMPADFVAGLAQ